VADGVVAVQLSHAVVRESGPCGPAVSELNSSSSMASSGVPVA
jgi:hypothetical protein